MGILGEFFNFFNAVVLGPPKDDEGSDRDEILSALQSQSLMVNINQVIQRKILEYSSTIDQDVIANKTITIDCGTEQLSDWHLEPRNEKYTWYGKEIPHSGCPQFGCCYDVTQTSQISLVAINKTESTNHTEMWNEIEQNLKNEVKAVVGNSNSQIGALTRSINAVKTTSIDNIKIIMDQAHDIDYETNPSITIEAKFPLRCMNECDEPPTAGEISQHLNVEIISQNIISNILKSVTENFIDMSSKTESKLSNIDIKKIYMFAILSVLLIVTVYTICYIISMVIIKVVAKKPNPPSIVVHLLAILLLIWVWQMYRVILCIIRKWPASMAPPVWLICLWFG